jgi:hypothetical protein
MMINKFYRNDPRYPLCYDCEEPIIEGEEYYRIDTKNGVHFHHAECFHDYHIQYMTDGGAE